MAELSASDIVLRIQDASDLYHRLVLLAAPPGSGKTSALLHVREATGVPVINVNLELSKRMLDLTERQRSIQLPRLLAQLVESSPADAVLLDNIELLFDPALKQDPLRLLQGLSRNKTLVVSWPGSVELSHLVYATQDHPEYRRYPVQGFLVVTPKHSGEV